MLSNIIGLALCVALLVLWVGAKHEDRLAAQRACHHRWVKESLYNEGRVWFRRCELCGMQRPADDPEHDVRPAPLRRPPRE